MVKMNIRELSAALSEEELRELEAAEAKKPVFDADSPEMTAEKIAQFHRMHAAPRTKQTVALRISPKTLAMAKAYGKGYTSFLSRLLDEAIQDEDLVRKCM